jgi:hypothetical protein
MNIEEITSMLEQINKAIAEIENAGVEVELVNDMAKFDSSKCIRGDYISKKITGKLNL